MQLISLVSALSVDTRYYILDEPTMNLDPDRRVILASVIDQLHRREDKTFLIASHIFDELAFAATNIIKLKKKTEFSTEIIHIKDSNASDIQIFVNSYENLRQFLETRNVKFKRIGNRITLTSMPKERMLNLLREGLWDWIVSIRILPHVSEVEED